MSQIKSAVVLRCSHCGKQIVLTKLSTTAADPEGTLLRTFMNKLAEKALCPSCQQSRNYYAAQNRLEDWEKGIP